MRTLWLKRDDGAICDFAPRINLYSYVFDGCWTKDHKGGGFKNRVTLQRVGKDFIPVRFEPEAQEYSLVARFLSDKHKEYFNSFIGDFTKPIKMYCSPDGRIVPNDQISKAWYHTVLIIEGESPFKDKNGIYNTEMKMQYLEGVWRRDVDIASTVEGVTGGALVHPYVYPYFYTEGSLLNTKILNEGEPIGCVIEITNKGTTPLSKIEYSVYDSEGNLQRCRWNIPEGLAAGRTLRIDSRERSQSAWIIYQDNKANAKAYGEEDITYINYPILQNGENKISFNFDRVNDVEVTVKYQQERVVI